MGDENEIVYVVVATMLSISTILNLELFNMYNDMLGEKKYKSFHFTKKS